MSTASITLTFIVPLMCSIFNGEPRCNTPLERIGNTWVGQGVVITYDGGKYVFKAE